MDDASKSRLIEEINEVSQHYHSGKLAGVNDIYHIYVRDYLISLTGGDSALEVGCGSGLWTRLLCERYNSVDIVDGSAELLAKVAEENKGRQANITTHHMLVEDFVNQPLQRWEHIYITFLLEHLLDPVDVLSRLKDRLLDHGVLFLSVPNALSVHRVIAHRMGLIDDPQQLSENDRMMGHKRVYTRALMHDHLTRAGLDVINLETITLKPLSLAQMDDWSVEMALGFCESREMGPDNGAYIVATARRRQIAADAI